MTGDCSQRVSDRLADRAALKRQHDPDSILRPRAGDFHVNASSPLVLRVVRPAAIALAWAALSVTPGSALAASTPGSAFTCDFGDSTQLNPVKIAPLLERDRMYMSARPGFVRKFVPLGVDLASGGLVSGGRYLFRTASDAIGYQHWIFNNFVLSGTEFFDRPYFMNPECHAWTVIGVADLAAYDRHQVVMRTERFRVPAGDQQAPVAARWRALVGTAQRRGLTGVWLLYDRPDRLVSIVYFADRVVPVPDLLDPLSLLLLEQQPALGAAFADQHWTRTFDRTESVLTLWFPFARGDHGRPSVWPNSPPLPVPYAGDGVCEVSRGENSATAPADCLPTCGNGVADPGETTDNCPGDVRPFKDEQYAPPSAGPAWGRTPVPATSRYLAQR